MGIIKYLLGWPLSLVSLYFVYKLIEPKLPNLLSRLSEVNWQILIYAIFCFFTYFLLRGFLWSEILKLKGYKIPFKKSLFLWNTSELKRYTPGNIWSFLGRTVSFNNLGVKKSDIIHSLLLESELIIAGTTIVSLMSLGFLFNILPDTFVEPVIQPVILLLCISLIFIFIFNPLKFSLLPKYKPEINLKLLFISTITFLIWAVGNYLAAVSLFFLSPRDFLSIVGFFSFSLLVGYLSIVTPMGLGVREGVITLGLSKLVSLEFAGFISIFIRVIFIISELIFLLLSWIWQKFNNSYSEKIVDLLIKNKKLAVVFILSLIYFAYVTHASFLRYDNFYAGRFDLGNMDQTVWNTINGRVFEFTNPDGTEIVSRLAFHADFLLILLSPFYLIWENPKILLLVQSFIISLGSLFVFLIADKYIKNKYTSLVLAFIFLINPSVNHANLFDFHPVVLATTFILAAFYFLKINKIMLSTLFLLLAALSKEQVWILVAMYGIYLFFSHKYKFLGLAIFAIATFIFWYLLNIAIPNAGNGKHFALKYYSQFGETPLEVIKNTVFSPHIVLPMIFEGPRFVYLNQLFLPFGYLAFSPYLIFAVPDLAINLLSSNSNLYTIFFQYTAIITPFLFISVIWMFVFLKRYLPKINLHVLTALILFTSLYSAWEFGPLPGAQQPNIAMFTEPLSNKEVVDGYIVKIPKEYSISTTNNLGSKLSQRRKIYTIPHGIENADMILFLLRKSPTDPGEKLDREVLRIVRNNSNHLEVFKDNGFIVFQRKDLRPLQF